METREIEPDVYHKFLTGIIYATHEDDGSTKVTIWQATLKRGTDIFLPFIVTEITTTHLQCIVFGFSRYGEELAVFRLTDCSAIYRLIYENGVFEVKRSTVEAKQWKGQILIDLKKKFNSQARIAAMEVAGFYVEPTGQSVFSIAVDSEPYPSNLKRDNDREFLKEAPHIPIEEVYRDFFFDLESIAQIDAGTGHLVILTKIQVPGGKVYVCGHFHKCELGLFEEDIIKFSKRNKPIEFIFLKAISDKSIVKISCGFYHNIALSRNSEVYGWGWNRYGQLNSSSQEFISTPTLLPIRQEEDSKVIDIKAEMNGSSYLIEEKTSEEDFDAESPEPVLISEGNCWDHWLP